MSVYLFSNSIAIDKRHTNSLTLIRKTNHIYDYLNKHNPDPRNVMITDRPGQYTILPMGALNVDYAQSMPLNCLQT